MIKEMEENLCRSLGRTRRRGNMIGEGRDSSLPSTKAVLIQINKINFLKMNLREKTLCEKGEYTNPMLGMQRRQYL
jgi:hypothetical protein